MEKLLGTIYQFSLTMDEKVTISLFGERLGKHLWSSYMSLNRDWIRWYGYLDSDNQKIIINYLNTII